MTAELTPQEQFNEFVQAERLSYYYLSGELENGIVLSDHVGFLMEHEEMLDVVASILYFYRNVSPERIQQHNQELYDKKFSPDRPRYVAPPKQRKPKPGYIYLLQSPTGAYKIGRATEPQTRIKKMAVKLPFEVETTCLIQTDDMVLLERELHEHFADRRADGEWFNLSDADVEYIKSLAEVAS